jgi:hypothetical protein
MLGDSGQIIPQSPEPQSMSGAWLNAYRVCPLYPPFKYVVTVARNFARLAGDCSVAELAESCL